MIRRINSNAELVELIEVLRTSFCTVAQQFGLTEANAPTNPAFVTMESLQEYVKKPVELFGMFLDGRMVGCVAVEPSKNNRDIFYIERLAVVPEERHQGHGDSLLSYAFERIAQKGARVASIGIMNENHQLKEWYKTKGFVETECKKFSHLHFQVCFMSKELYGTVTGKATDT